MIGSSIPSNDAADKVTGKTTYAGDVKLPGMLYGKLKRASLPHGRILKINSEKARQLPGVKTVVTAKDAPKVRFGWFIKDRSLFCQDGEIRYIGEPIAGVVATEERIAEEATRLIEVDYEPLPSVFDPLEAMKEGAPLVHKDISTYEAGWSPVIKSHGNACSSFTYETGDLEGGFAGSDVIIEDRYKTPIVHQAYMEPHVAIAKIETSGQVVFWTSVQIPDIFHGFIAEILGVPMSKVRILAPAIGGSFGAKFENLCAAYAFVMAKKAQRPVKLAWTREEEFIDGHPRHGSVISMKLGAKNDGTLMAMKAEMFYDSGAYAVWGPGLTENGASAVTGPYRIPNIRVDGHCVYTNKTVTGAYRGYGTPQAMFAIESQMDGMETTCFS